MRDRLLLAGLICCAPLAIGWLLYRGIQWERRKGFHGRYDVPVEPLDPSLWAEMHGRAN